MDGQSGQDARHRRHFRQRDVSRCRSETRVRQPGMAVLAPDPTLLSALLVNLDIEALDLLVEGGERDAELLGGVGLVSVAAIELFDDDAALDVFENVEERGVGGVFEQGVVEAA